MFQSAISVGDTRVFERLVAGLEVEFGAPAAEVWRGNLSKRKMRIFTGMHAQRSAGSAPMKISMTTRNCSRGLP